MFVELKLIIGTIKSEKIGKQSYRNEDKDVIAEIVSAEFEDYKLIQIKGKNDEEKNFFVSKNMKGEIRQIYNYKDKGNI